jgi:hypothetical protein
VKRRRDIVERFSECRAQINEQYLSIRYQRRVMGLKILHVKIKAFFAGRFSVECGENVRKSGLSGSTAGKYW